MIFTRLPTSTSGPTTMRTAPAAISTSSTNPSQASTRESSTATRCAPSPWSTHQSISPGRRAMLTSQVAYPPSRSMVWVYVSGCTVVRSSPSGTNWMAVVRGSRSTRGRHNETVMAPIYTPPRAPR